MFTRKVECNLKTTKLNDARRVLTNEVQPLLRNQPGFVDVIEALEPETGHFVCMTFWKTREELDRYDRETFPRIADKLSPYLTEQPTVQNLQVENSTIHNIAAGKAAA